MPPIETLWPIFALGVICGGLLCRILRLLTTPVPTEPDPPADWTEYHRRAEEARKNRKGGGQ